MRGLCSWKPQPICAPAAFRMIRVAAIAMKLRMTPAV